MNILYYYYSLSFLNEPTRELFYPLLPDPTKKCKEEEEAMLYKNTQLVDLLESNNANIYSSFVIVALD